MRLDSNQQGVFIAISMVIVLMFLFPPAVKMSSKGFVGGYGYYFFNGIPSYCTIDSVQLLVQLLGVTVVAGLLLFAFKKD